MITAQEILKILAGTSKIIKQSGESIANRGADFLEQNILQGKYVSYEEHEQLKKLVLKLQSEVKLLQDSIAEQKQNQMQEDQDQLCTSTTDHTI